MMVQYPNGGKYVLIGCLLTGMIAAVAAVWITQLLHENDELRQRITILEQKTAGLSIDNGQLQDQVVSSTHKIDIQGTELLRLNSIVTAQIDTIREQSQTISSLNSSLAQLQPQGQELTKTVDTPAGVSAGVADKTNSIVGACNPAPAPVPNDDTGAGPASPGAPVLIALLACGGVTPTAVYIRRLRATTRRLNAEVLEQSAKIQAMRERYHHALWLDQHRDEA